MKKILSLILLVLLPLVAIADDPVKIGGIYYVFKGNTAEVVHCPPSANSVNDGNLDVYSGNIVIPASVTYDGMTYTVTSIGVEAFCGYWGLTSVSIPESVTNIGLAAFSNCAILNSVNIPEGVDSIAEQTFMQCGSLTSISIPNSVKSIGLAAFLGSGLITVTIGSGVTNIAEHAFMQCENLKSVTIPEGVTSIGDFAFSDCYNLTFINIPSSVTSIGEYAFQLCVSLEKVIVPDIAAWCGISFGNYSANPIACAHHLYCNETTEITELVIPESVTSIGNYVFYGCSGLTSITIPNSVTNIGYGAFSHCSGLTSITIPNRVTSIGDEAFYRCHGLTSVTIPNSVTSIGKYAFEDCSGLEKVIVPDIAAWCSISFYGESANPLQYAHHLYSDESTEITDLVIPNGVTSIGDYAFYECRNLTSATIPEGLTNIGKYAFYYCDKLISVAIPNSVTRIGYYAFYGCSALRYNKYDNAYYLGSSDNPFMMLIKPVSTYIELCEINEKCRTISEEAFNGCRNLISITIPADVTRIGEKAFYSCSGLTSIKITAGNATYDSRHNCNAIIETATNTLIIGCQNTVIPEGVTSIGKYAFYECHNLLSVTIPESVTSIDEHAFENCESLTSVIIPNSVIRIGEYTFYRCEGLTAVTIGSGVTSIGSHAFSKCSNITTLNLDCETIRESFVSQCFSDSNEYLQTLILGEHVTCIGRYAFSGCKSLTDVYCYAVEPPIAYSEGWNDRFYSFDLSDIEEQTTLHVSKDSKEAYRMTAPWSQFWKIVSFDGNNTDIQFADASVWAICVAKWDTDGDNELSEEEAAKVTSIGQEFSGSTIKSFNELQYFSGLTSIEEKAFSGCKDLISIIIPESVTSIGANAFENCYNLTSIYIPNGVTSIGGETFKSCSNLASVNIPDGVTSIEEGTFDGCESLTSIIIPEGVTNIGSWAFSGCSGLTSIDIPNSVTSIGTAAFDETAWFNNQPDGLVYAGNVAYLYKQDEVEMPEDTNIALRDGTKGIAECAFYDCSGLTSITIPDGVINIGAYAFSDCSSLTSVTIPESVTSIGKDAFARTPWYNNQKGLVYLGRVAYEYKGDKDEMPEGTEIVIKDGTVRINDRLFEYCYGLTSVTIPESVTSIGEEAFAHCYNLTSVNIPEGVTCIMERTFDACVSIPYINIPKSVTSIGSGAFSFCKSLTSVNIPNGVISIGYNAFGGCESLTTVTLESDGVVSASRYYEDSDGIYYSSMADIFGSQVETYFLGDAVTSIGEEAFAYCYNLTSVNIPDGVTSIGVYAFFDCSNLASVNIPENLSSIEEGTFNGCSALTSVTIPANVTSIGDNAFQGCSGLTSVTIPENVNSIGNYVFWDCERLTTVTLESNAIVSTSRIYWDDSWWRDGNSSMASIFGEQVEEYILGDAITSIGDGAFYDCYNLASINIPEGVTNIGNGAFYDCYNLASINIPEGVTNIGNCAFYGCSGLTSINIPEGVTSIGNYAFVGCESLTDVIIPESVISIGEEMFPFESTPWYDNQEGLIYVGKILYEYKGELPEDTDITIKDGTVRIASYAFNRCDYCENLISVTIPNSVTSIGKYAFDGTAWFENQPDGLVYAGNVAYRYKQYESEMPEDTKIELKDGTLGIADYAFEWCYNLTSITIPKSVTNIGNYAFYDCESLTDVYCYATEPPTVSYYNSENEENEYAFYIDYIWEHTTLHVPEGSVEAYRTMEPWSYFRFITDEVTIIDAVEDVKAEDATNSEYYDLNGHKLDAPQNGINIFRYSDGSTRKVLIKE